MLTVVYGCFGCAHEEQPQYTFTTMYKDKDGKYKMHWLCRSCVRRFNDQDKLRDLTHEDMHPQAQEHFNGCSPSREVETITQGTP